jgi:type VI secretion system protein ImpF
VLQASVRRQLEWILSTRRSVTVNEALREDALTVTEFGIPDWSSLSSRDAIGCDQFALAVEMAVKAFEPRLSHVSVTAESGKGREETLRICISGMLKLTTATEDVSFPFEFTTAPSADAA